MKYFQIASAFVIATIVLAGCNSTTSPNGTTTTPNTMTATVNGSSWSSDVIPGLSATGITKAYKNGNIVTVTGVSALDNTEISLILINPVSGTTDSLGATGNEGTYSKILGVADTTIYVSEPSLSSFSLYDGSVTISSYDTVAKTISGSFHFIARLPTNPSDTMNVASGSFYQVGW